MRMMTRMALRIAGAGTAAAAIAAAGAAAASAAAINPGGDFVATGAQVNKPLKVRLTGVESGVVKLANEKMQVGQACDSPGEVQVTLDDPSMLVLGPNVSDMCVTSATSG